MHIYTEKNKEYLHGYATPVVCNIIYYNRRLLFLLLLWLQLENTIFVFEGGCVGRHLHLKTYMENMWKINAQCSDCTWISILYVVMKILQPSSYMQFVLKICSFVCQLDALCLPLLHK